MKKGVLFLVLGVASLYAVPQEAEAWSEATHAYIADHIGKSYGSRNLNEIYGAMVPDLFNLQQFDPAYTEEQYQCARTYTHGFIPESNGDFMALWDEAGWGLSKNIAYGYVSHNDVWGADVATHWDGLTNEEPESLPNPEFYPDPLSEVGWVMEKARELIDYFDAQGVWADLEIPLDPTSDPWSFTPAELFCQFLVMKAGDVVIKRNDPMIGTKMAMAAMMRAPEFNKVLVDAISCVDSELVSSAEREFRNQTMLLGFMLMQNEKIYLNTIANRMSALAPDFLQAAGISYTPEKQAIIDQLVSEGLKQALFLIEDDYMVEIDAVVEYLRVKMSQELGSY